MIGMEIWRVQQKSQSHVGFEQGEKKNQIVPEDECLNLALQEQSWNWEMWEVFSSVTPRCGFCAAALPR